MKTLLTLFAVATLITYAGARCYYGCTCYTDDICEYYCSGSQCQYSIPLGNRCTGYSIHPRECGAVSYCEPSTMTCRLQKNRYEQCFSDYSCLSGYCDFRTNTCEYRSAVGWAYYILIPCLFVILIFVLVLVIVLRRRQRRMAYATYPHGCVAVPIRTPYSYQNPYAVGEAPPPSYSNISCAQKPY